MRTGSLVIVTTSSRHIHALGFPHFQVFIYMEVMLYVHGEEGYRGQQFIQEDHGYASGRIANKSSLR